jgi:hypothetical protein
MNDKISADQDRITARYAELERDLREQPRLPAAGDPVVDEVDWTRPEVPAAHHVDADDGWFTWTAPEQRGETGFGPAGWMRLADLEDATRASQEARAQAWERIIRLVVVDQEVPSPEAPGDALTAMRLWMDKYQQADLPGPRRLEAGETAVAAIRATATQAPAATSWPGDEAGNLAHLMTGIPIVPNDEDLEPGQWRLLDTQTGEVLHEGTIRPDLAEYVRVAKEAVEQLADEAEMPRNLLAW